MIQFILVRIDYFTPNFDRKDNHEKNIDSEPWYLNQAGPFSRNGTLASTLEQVHLPAWLRITFLLHEFWNEETFAAIANDLGKFAKFLDITTPNKMSTCAKIYLEMDNPPSSYT
jgi:hypothetical protein